MPQRKRQWGKLWFNCDIKMGRQVVKQGNSCIILTFFTQIWTYWRLLWPPEKSFIQHYLWIRITHEVYNQFYRVFDVPNAPRSENMPIWGHIWLFTLHVSVAGGLNTTPRAPYWVISLSYDNRRKNLSTVWWFSRIFENHRALVLVDKQKNKN